MEFKGTKEIVVLDVTDSRIQLNENTIDLWFGDDFGISKEEQEANANILIAAPALLEALQEILGHIPIGHDFFTEGESKAMLMAEQAIEKALK